MSKSPELDPQTAIINGGWDARYARVLDVATWGKHAAALVDANGDGADINLDLFRHRSGEWQVMESGHHSVSADGVWATWNDDDRLVLTHDHPRSESRRIPLPVAIILSRTRRLVRAGRRH